jgi:RNA polymerase sigma factor for flagellar operon FliA
LPQDITTLTDDTAALWEAYRARGSADARESLILHYAPLVKYVAGRIRSRAPTFVEQADLTSVGIFGLIDAVERFDPARGVRFESYAITRIRGAILDELRKVDRVPRSVRTMARRIDEAQSELQLELKRTPTDEEIAEHLGVDVSAVWDVMRQVGEAAVLGLDQITYGAEGGSASLIDRVIGVPGEPGRGPAAQERRTLLVEAINELEERERMVVTLYYFGGLTLADIAEVMGLSEARICQIRGRAVETLRMVWRSDDPGWGPNFSPDA